MKQSTEKEKEIIIKEDTQSADVLKSLQASCEKFNAYLSDFEKNYNVTFTDEDLDALSYINSERARVIARKYYFNLPPIMRETARQELADALQIMPIGKESLQNLLKFRNQTINFDSDRTNLEFITIKNSRFVVLPDALERMQKHFTKKISGQNLHFYHKAKEIEELMDELHQDGFRFTNIFQQDFNGEKLFVREMSFVDADY